MQKATVGVDDQGKESKEGQKWNDTRIKNLLLVHTISHARIQASESDGRWKVHIRLDERDHLGATLWRRHHEDILCVSQDRVVEQNAEKHDAQRKKLLTLVGGRKR